MRGDGDPHAHGDVHVLACEGEREGGYVQDGAGDGAGLDGARQAPEQDGELVAAEAGDDVVGVEDPLQAVGEAPEHEVAHGVAEAVVHGLEVVDVHEEHADVGAVGAHSGEGGGDVAQEHRPVRELREGVVLGAVQEVLLDELAFRDVGEGTHVAGVDVRAGEPAHAPLQDPPPRAVAVGEAVFDLARAGGAHGPPVVVGHHHPVVRVHESEPSVAEGILPGAAHEVLPTPVHGCAAAVGAGHPCHHRRGAGHAPQGVAVLVAVRGGGGEVPGEQDLEAEPGVRRLEPCRVPAGGEAGTLRLESRSPLAVAGKVPSRPPGRPSQVLSPSARVVQQTLRFP